MARIASLGNSADKIRQRRWLKERIPHDKRAWHARALHCEGLVSFAVSACGGPSVIPTKAKPNRCTMTTQTEGGRSAGFPQVAQTFLDWVGMYSVAIATAYLKMFRIARSLHHLSDLHRQAMPRVCQMPEQDLPRMKRAWRAMYPRRSSKGPSKKHPEQFAPLFERICAGETLEAYYRSLLHQRNGGSLLPRCIWPRRASDVIYASRTAAQTVRDRRGPSRADRFQFQANLLELGFRMACYFWKAARQTAQGGLVADEQSSLLIVAEAIKATHLEVDFVDWGLFALQNPSVSIQVTDTEIMFSYEIPADRLPEDALRSLGQSDDGQETLVFAPPVSAVLAGTVSAREMIPFAGPRFAHWLMRELEAGMATQKLTIYKWLSSHPSVPVLRVATVWTDS